LFPITFCLFGFSGYFEYGAAGLVTFMKYFPPDGSLMGCITSLIMMFVWFIYFVYFVANYLLVILVFIAKYFWIIRWVLVKLGIDKCVQRQEEKKKQKELEKQNQSPENQENHENKDFQNQDFQNQDQDVKIDVVDN